MSFFTFSTRPLSKVIRNTKYQFSFQNPSLSINYNNFFKNQKHCATSQFLGSRKFKMSTSTDSETFSHPSDVFTFQQTMLRIKDPSKSLPFYEDILGFKRLHEYHFSSFSLYFLYTPTEEDLNNPELQALKPGSKEAEDYLWRMKGTTIELTHNHGSEIEGDENYVESYESGNQEPYRGFGHLAIACNDVYKTCEEYEAKGVTFQKKPNEGNMKGLAFIKDPDGYWIEVISRAEKPYSRVNLAQTMMRINNPEKSLNFYCDHLGLIKLAEKHFPQWKFSLYFLTKEIPAGYTRHTLPSPDSPEAFQLMKNLHEPVLELTHNHGDYKYCNGNEPLGEGRGFGHIGFLVKGNLDDECKKLEDAGYIFQKKPSDGGMRNLAFVLDPDNYWVELIQEGASFL